jgi:hypothetical protein
MAAGASLTRGRGAGRARAAWEGQVWAAVLVGGRLGIARRSVAGGGGRPNGTMPPKGRAWLSMRVMGQLRIIWAMPRQAVEMSSERVGVTK